MLGEMIEIKWAWPDTKGPEVWWKVWNGNSAWGLEKGREAYICITDQQIPTAKLPVVYAYL